MSDDKYPRVRGSKPPAAWFAEGGTHKVVPADAIVIERDDLPEVTAENAPSGRTSCLKVSGVLYVITETPEWYEKRARNYLAVAEYLRANQPVDEAQVEAVTAALYEATQGPDDIDVPDVARRLVARGVRVGVEK